MKYLLPGLLQILLGQEISSYPSKLPQLITAIRGVFLIVKMAKRRQLYLTISKCQQNMMHVSQNGSYFRSETGARGYRAGLVFEGLGWVNHDPSSLFPT